MIYIFLFSHGMEHLHVGSQFRDQGLNLGQSNEDTESPLDHQGTLYFLCISFCCLFFFFPLWFLIIWSTLGMPDNFGLSVGHWVWQIIEDLDGGKHKGRAPY